MYDFSSSLPPPPPHQTKTSIHHHQPCVAPSAKTKWARQQRCVQNIYKSRRSQDQLDEWMGRFSSSLPPSNSTKINQKNIPSSPTQRSAICHRNWAQQQHCICIKIQEPGRAEINDGRMDGLFLIPPSTSLSRCSA